MCDRDQEPDSARRLSKENDVKDGYKRKSGEVVGEENRLRQS